jgi:HAD superfamily phosphoserine phosphatase-like hydrolase
MTKFAVFDIDGTLYRWQLYHELVQTLALADVFSHDAPSELDAKYNEWRAGEISFAAYEEFVVATMMQNLPSVPLDVFDTACDKIVKESAHKTYYFPRALLTKLKKQGYTIIAITGSQQELIDRFGKRYGFDIVVGAEYERAHNRFTGKIRPTIGRKPEILRDIVEKHGLQWADSVAIGDSGGDASILELVENPVAFNPDSALFQRAKHEGWSIVVERKNIAYTLEKRGDELVLADTITY